MSITSSGLTVTVEPDVTEVEITSNSYITAGTTMTLTVTTRAKGIVVPAAPVTIYWAVATQNYSSGTKLNSVGFVKGTLTTGVTDTKGVFTATMNTAKLPPESGAYNFAVQAESEGIFSNIIYLYPSCAITITASTDTPISGTQYTVKVHVSSTPNAESPSNFGSESTTVEAKDQWNGFCWVVLWNTTTNTLYSSLKTDSSGNVSYPITTTTAGSDTYIAVADGSAENQTLKEP
jgi:hypothetical protein